MSIRKWGTVALIAVGSVAFAPIAGAVEADDPAPAVTPSPTYSAPAANPGKRFGEHFKSAFRGLTPRDDVDPDAHYFASTGGIPA